MRDAFRVHRFSGEENPGISLGAQCCGSGMISSRVLDPPEFHSGSWIPDPKFRIPDSGSRVRILDPTIKEKGQIFKTAPRAFLMSQNNLKIY
jgi:hypothetical protein